MAPLPKILIIDDMLGADPPIPYRQNFCQALQLWDNATPFDPGREVQAEVTFHSGQLVTAEFTENDPEGALKAILSGWPFDTGGYWALVCLDLDFNAGLAGSFESTPFGLELLAAIQRDPRLRGGRNPALPVVMLSRHDPQMVQDKALEARANLDDVQFFQKWDPAHARVYPKPSHDFAALLFDRGLVEDGALKAVSKDGVVSPIVRDSPLIDGSSLSLLGALRDGRATLTRSVHEHFLIVAEPGDDARPIVQYLHDLRKIAVREILGEASIEGGVGPFQSPPAEKGKPSGQKGGVAKGTSPPSTLTIDHLEDEEPAALDRLRAIMREKGGKERVQVLALAASDALADLATRRQWPDLVAQLQPINWPPLRDRPEDIAPMFLRFLKMHDNAQAVLTRKVAADALRALRGHDWPDNVRQLKAVAKDVARYNRHRPTVTASDVMAVIGAGKAGPRESRLLTLEELLSEMAAFRFKPHELPGAWPKLSGAFAGLLTSMFDLAAVLNVNGDAPNHAAIGQLLRLPHDGKGEETQRFIRRVAKAIEWRGATVDRMLARRHAKSAISGLFGGDQ